MKNLSLILNIVLLLAVLYLYVDRFSSSKPAASQPEVVDGEQTPPDRPLRIVYINLDSLHAKSEGFQAKKKELEQRQAAAEASLKTKGNSFQKEVLAYQQKLQSGTMTPKLAQEEEGRLAQKEQAIMAESDRVTKELLEATDKFNEQFTNTVRGHLDSLKAELKYDYILVYGSGSPVLVANDSFDITGTVLNLLNKKK